MAGSPARSRPGAGHAASQHRGRNVVDRTDLDPERAASSPSTQSAPIPPMTAGTLRHRGISAASVAGLQRSSGNAAVAGLLAGQQVQRSALTSYPATGSPVVQRREALQRKEKRRGGLVFHPKSTLSAAKIVGMLKRNKNVPDFLKKSIAARNGAIVLVGKLPTKPDGTFSEFLEPYLAALTSSEWQFTTATSTIEVTGEPGSPQYLQIVRPDLASGQRLGKDIKSGPGETTFFATPLYSSKSEVIYGWTVESGDTGKIGAGRGLVVLVTKITVTGQNGRKKVFTPTEDVVLESVLHEISAHAGRMSEGKPDTHGDRGVDDIAKEIGEFFRWNADARGVVPSSTSKEIFEFIDRTATAPK